MIAALQIHYLGKSQKEYILNHARKVKYNVFYEPQGTYTFSKFATDLEETFTTLRDYKEPISKTDKLHLLCEKIKTDNASFNASVIRILFCPDIKTLSAAAAEINVIASTFFSTEHSGRGEGVCILPTEISCFVHTSCDGNNYNNGIDITDPAW
eukprot:14488756-Ditylum_brightwellii.AAC.1